MLESYCDCLAPTNHHPQRTSSFDETENNDQDSETEMTRMEPNGANTTQF